MSELQLRIYYHRWGGVTCGLAELANKAELNQMGPELWLNWSLEDFPGWGGMVGVGKNRE